MTKPPGFASSSTLPMEDEGEESIDDSLDEILLEANEKPQENSVKSLEAVPSSLEESEIGEEESDVIESSPMSMSAGGTASPPGEITVIAPRPTFADDEVFKEETKVDPYETAIRAAALRDEGLTSQASHQRARALRKTANTPVRAPSHAALAEVEFEDVETGDEEAFASSPSGEHSERTPADRPIGEDSGSPPAGGFATASGYVPRLPPPGRPMPPPGRPDIYPGRRIPTPSSDFGLSPSSGFGSGAHYPSIAIPAPSGYDSSTRNAAVRGDNRVRLPAAGLAMFLVTAFSGGLLVGAMLWRGRAPSGPVDLPVVTHSVSRPIVAEPVQPIVKPVPSPASATAPAPAAAVAAGTTSADIGSAGPAMPTMAAETAPVLTEMPPPGEKPKKAKPKKTTTLDEDLAAAADEPPPPPTRPRKKKIPWQDPFAQ
ncbi:MAG TPA: hypothetical protein VFH68_01590 [Polyangia bacterium]|nr:hypothetical protein [Polyangia bacterium]